MKTSLGWLLMLLMMAVRVPSAWADGGYFFGRAGVGYSADQTAILIHDPEAGRQTMILHTGQHWTDPSRKADYAWVVPVPSLMRQADFTTVADGHAAFRHLYEVSEPRARIAHSAGCMYGCGGPASEDGAAKTTAPRVLDAFQVDDYQIQILSADDSRNLQEWLQENGYGVPAEAAPALQHYIDRSWYFTAVKVNLPEPGAASDGDADPGAAPPKSLDPLKMTFTTDRLVFPLRISAVSSRPRQPTEVLLYVLAPYRVETQNFPTVQMPLLRQSFSSVTEFHDCYQREFRSALREAGGRAFVVEYAGPLSSADTGYYPPPSLGWLTEGRHLTRLRTELLPEQMDADVELARAPTDAPFQVVARVRHRTYDGVRLAFLGSLYGMATLNGIRGRRRDRWVRGYLAATLLALLVL